MSKCAALFAMPFSWLSSHYENSKSTSGYLCELKQILVDFLRAFRGVASHFLFVRPFHTSRLQRKGGCSKRGGRARVKFAYDLFNSCFITAQGGLYKIKHFIIQYPHVINSEQPSTN